MMRKTFLGLLILAWGVPAAAQPGGAPPGDGPRGGPGRIKAIKPVERARFDKIVADMFREADRNRDALVTIEEVRAIVSARRDVLIAKRFERIDRNGDRTISRDEYFDWQRSLGSVAQSDEAQSIGRDGLVPETIEPEYRDEMEARLLLGLIEPLSAGLIAKANLDYYAGLSLAELAAYEGKRFEDADRDRDGAISMGEARQPEGRLPGGAVGLPPPRPRETRPAGG